MLLRPLFFTSYLIDDFRGDAGLLDSATIVLSSASSKTAIGLAFLLSQREGTRVIGLTSERSKEFAARLGVYASVLPYEELDALPPGPAVYVDMAGDAEVREGVHGHLGSSLTHSAVVGATHHDRMGDVRFQKAIRRRTQKRRLRGAQRCVPEGLGSGGAVTSRGVRRQVARRIERRDVLKNYCTLFRQRIPANDARDPISEKRAAVAMIVTAQAVEAPHIRSGAGATIGD